MEDLLLSICCITYNHEKYIREALQGFVNQKTNFNFEIIISNDCSTDNTQEVIDEYKTKYPELIRDISPKENLGALKNYYYALSHCKGKYIAYCEGDDYWCDDNKLQLQVDFLEKNPDYGLVYTKEKQYLQSKKKFLISGGYQISFHDLLTKANPIGALSTCYRRDLYEKYMQTVHPETKNWLMGDYPLWIYIAYNSNIKCLETEMVVYRVLDNSASHFTNIDKYIAFRKSVYDIRNYYNCYFNINADITWDESVYYVPLHFNAGHRKQLRDYSKSVSRKNDRIKVKLAKYPVLFYIVFFINRIKIYILTFFHKQ